MAYNSSSAPAAQTNTEWKANGFINLYLPDAETGKPRKVGALALKTSNKAENSLLTFLNADPANLAKVMAALTADFRAVDDAKPVGFRFE